MKRLFWFAAALATTVIVAFADIGVAGDPSKILQNGLQGRIVLVGEVMDVTPAQYAFVPSPNNFRHRARVTMKVTESLHGDIEGIIDFFNSPTFVFKPEVGWTYKIQMTSQWVFPGDRVFLIARRGEVATLDGLGPTTIIFAKFVRFLSKDGEDTLLVQDSVEFDRELLRDGPPETSYSELLGSVKTTRVATEHRLEDVRRMIRELSRSGQ